MQKTDESIRRICIASIKRHTIKPIDYPLTRIFEKQSLSEIDKVISSTFNHLDNELPIAITYVDINNWTLLTTKRIISNIKGVLTQTFASKVVKRTWGDFKGYKEKPTTLGYLTLNDNTTMNILTETGAASMIMIYGIMTLTGQETSTEEQINKTLKRYQNRGFFDELD
jgi:hypothetical protein